MNLEHPPKLPGTSLDISAENRARLKQLFPTVFTETRNEQGELVESIDFEKLKAELGTFSDVFEARRERYGMDWPGKKEALRLIQTTSAATLKPCRAESVNFDTTENLFIEGDNLEVLKLLQKSYYGKVKMIYIDPPYNTGKEFIYPDNFTESLETYLEYAGLIAGDGKKFSTNTTNEGRFHTKWLNMMYPRLYLARNLLRDDGVIFISIDDHEVSNLRKLCDEIFGEENFVAILVWEKKKKGAFLSGDSTNIKEYILVYVKSKSDFQGLLGEIASQEETYPVIKTTNSRGIRVIKKGIVSKYKHQNHVVEKNTRISSGNMELILLDDLIIRDGVLSNDVSVESNWIYSQELLNQYAENHELYITQDLYFRRIVKDPREKKLKDILSRVGTNGDSKPYFIYSDDLFLDGWGTNEDAFDELHGLFQAQNVLEFPKPSKLIAKLTLSCTRYEEEAIILDFFSGSATTAHALLDLNQQDSGNRKFILVQLPEPCAPDSEAFKAGYQTIAEIGKERIRRVIRKMEDERRAKEKEAQPDLFSQNEPAAPPDLGFKVYKLDQSNFKPWQPLAPTTPPEILAQQLELHIDHIDPRATAEDLLYEILLKAGFTLTEKVETKTLAGQPVYSVAEGALLLCLEDKVTKELIDAVIEANPQRFICLDAAFQNNDQLKANAVQAFNAHNLAQEKTNPVTGKIEKEKHNQIIFRTV